MDNTHKDEVQAAGSDVVMRHIEVQVDQDVWMPVQMQDLKAGQVFRMFDLMGTYFKPVIDHTTGAFEWVVIGEPVCTLGTYVVACKPAPKRIDGMPALQQSLKLSDLDQRVLNLARTPLESNCMQVSALPGV